jgi:hypothetical protein
MPFLTTRRGAELSLVARSAKEAGESSYTLIPRRTGRTRRVEHVVYEMLSQL